MGEQQSCRGEQAVQGSPEFFSDGRTWEMERDYSLQSTVADRYVTSCAMNTLHRWGASQSRV
jgi:hypothetical protein